MQESNVNGDWESSKKFSSGRGKETLFRVELRNQVDLISIADKKANMITSFNAVFISIVVTLFGSGIPVQGTPLIERSSLVIPFSILLLFCLISAVYAIMAATPRIRKPDESKGNEKRSLLFFGNFHQMTQEQYMNNVLNLLHSKNGIYEHLSIDMYNNGLILHRKYKMVGLAYKLLMFGVIGFVLSFLVTTAIEFA